MYFEQRLFLIPQTQDRTTSSNYSPMTDWSGEDDTDERLEDEQGSSGWYTQNFYMSKATVRK